MLPAIRLLLLSLILFVVVGVSSAAAVEPRRVALVIGNNKYEHVPALTNPANDARLIGEVLRQLGFDLIGGGPLVDLNRDRMENAIRDFAQKIGPGTVAVFYYAGHGIQIRGENFLIPITADLHSANDVDFELVNVGVVLRQMELRESTLNLVILDACRNNPFADRLLSDGGAGLAQMRSPRGTVIAFATQPGDVAQDGRGRDSPFSIALSKEMPKPNVSMLDMFNNVSADVNASTNKQQLPWVSSSAVDQTFYLGGDLGHFASKLPVGGTAAQAGANANKKTAELQMSPQPGFLTLPNGQGPPTVPPKEREVSSDQPTPPSAAQQPPSTSEVLLWQNVQYSRNILELEAYLAQFPNGVFSGLAKIRISELQNSASSQIAMATPAAPKPVAPPPVLCKVESRDTGNLSLDSERHYKLTVSSSGPACPIVNRGTMFQDYHLSDEPRHGTVAIELADNGFVVKVTYTPEHNFTGDDSFMYRLLPGNGRRLVTVAVGP